MIRRPIIILLAAAIAATAGLSAARADEASATVAIATKDGTGETVGTVRFVDGQYGLLVIPDLAGLTAGPHGTHVHEDPDCGPSQDHHGMAVPAGAAGGHYDPAGTGRHAGPYGDGHLGDLPNLIVEADGTATIPVLAPRVKVSDIRNRALMIHAEADRYTDHGAHHHGMGGMRMYCGVIE